MIDGDDTPPSSPPTTTVVALVPTTLGEPDWQPILHASNQVVLYNPTSHALSIRHSSNLPARPRPPCPYCKQLLPEDFEPDTETDGDGQIESLSSDPAYDSRASDYFQLLAIANETNSRPSSPPPIADRESEHERRGSAFPAEAMAEGYFKAFFQEEVKLGMGANGSVFLCQHVLDGNPLGHFAVKKIAVGESHSYLLKILREVRLLEQLHHPNIITYHHAWLETCQFSSFGPKVPTLHVLMQWAEGGSLDDFIDARLGRGTHHIHIDPTPPFSDDTTTTTNINIKLSTSSADPTTPTLKSSRTYHRAGPSTVHDPDHEGNNPDQHSRSARIRAFRALQRASPEQREKMRREMEEVRGQHQQGTSWKAVHLLSAEEVKSLFADVVEGLAFLHNKSILHLDLKPGNVLLTQDEGRLIPRAMLSDFGTSRDRLSSARTRSGNTGTLEYSSPESLPSPITGLLHQIDSKADMWSLGMILHKLLFFRLPYRYAADGDATSDTATLSLHGGSNNNGGPAAPTTPGIPGRGTEADKLDRLEKEVLGYAGFKSTLGLVTAFEARRLPRAFLVVLEGLLNVVPGGRPSCERVAGAIREGRLDPLKEAGGGGGGGSGMGRREGEGELVPLVRRRSDPMHMQEGLGGPGAGTGTGTGEEAAGGSPRMPSGAWWLGPQDQIQKPLLTLPAPREETVGRWGLRWWLWSEKVQARLGVQVLQNHGMWGRTLKSCILVAKVLTISSVCAEGEMRPAVVGFLLVVAISDTWFEELWVSVVFAVVHVLVVRVGCLTGWCCRVG